MPRLPDSILAALSEHDQNRAVVRDHLDSLPDPVLAEIMKFMEENRQRMPDGGMMKLTFTLAELMFCELMGERVVRQMEEMEEREDNGAD